LWIAVQWLFVGLFLFSVAVQYNDPDPVQWMAVYSGAAVAQVAVLRGWRWARLACLLTLFAALGWALTYYLGARPFVPLARMFDQFEMRDIAVEETREAMGLTIVSVWMAVLLLRPRLASSKLSW
jgi:hypothetical protein